MTKEEIRRAIREAESYGKKDDLVEAFKIMYVYDLVKGSDMARLWQVLGKA